MASTMPIPAPPRTPTPPPDENDPHGNTGASGVPYAIADEVLYDPNSLSPADPNARFAPMQINTSSIVPSSAGSSVYSPLYPESGKSDITNPFNFETTSMAKPGTVIKSVGGQTWNNETISG